MTEPRKTPRTDAMVNGEWIKYEKHARALEIETQELAEALEDMVAIYSEDDIDDEFPALSRARAALAHHRAKQEGSK